MTTSAIPSAGRSGKGGSISTLIPARIDRLPWSPFFTKMVLALGVAWVLDGLEIQIASVIGDVLTHKDTLGLSSGAVGDIATWYLLGEVVGALFFGRLSDKLGRRNLFMITLLVYLVGSGLTALTLGSGGGWVAYLYLTRVIAGIGIGGEYAAINSAIDEMIPARFRGRVDIAVNGTYWGGAFLATIAQLILLRAIPEHDGWRIGFLLGPALGVCVLFVRRNLPESPRWLAMHGRMEEAEAAIREIEKHVERQEGPLPELDKSKAIELSGDADMGFIALTKVLFTRLPKRSILGAALMITQSFLYNAIFFTYSLVLGKFYGVSSPNLPYYFMAFAAGNLLGPLTIGRLFDSIGRRIMISTTYIGAGAMLAVTAVLFRQGILTATTQTVAWSVIFFFASAGASAAYLTVSEIFPIEVRAKAIAVFFAIAQGFGSLGPHIYGHLIGDGSNPDKLFIGYLIGAGIMVLGGLAEVFFGIDAEGKSLEDIASPLSALHRDAPAGPPVVHRPPAAA
jgi:MFS family permease